MKINSMILAVGIAAAQGILWLMAPGLATVTGVVFGLFMIASWREGAKGKRPGACNSFHVDDFQRRLAA